MKLFEEHDQLYCEIDERLYSDKEFEMVDFPEKTIEVLSKMVGHIFSAMELDNKKFIVGRSMVGLDGRRIVSISGHGFSVFVNMDDYYYVRVRFGGRNQYYECDELSGLKNL